MPIASDRPAKAAPEFAVRREDDSRAAKRIATRLRRDGDDGGPGAWETQKPARAMTVLDLWLTEGVAEEVRAAFGSGP